MSLKYYIDQIDSLKNRYEDYLNFLNENLHSAENEGGIGWYMLGQGVLAGDVDESTFDDKKRELTFYLSRCVVLDMYHLAKTAYEKNISKRDKSLKPLTELQKNNIRAYTPELKHFGEIKEVESSKIRYLRHFLAHSVNGIIDGEASGYGLGDVGDSIVPRVQPDDVKIYFSIIRRGLCQLDECF